MSAPTKPDQVLRPSAIARRRTCPREDGPREDGPRAGGPRDRMRGRPAGTLVIILGGIAALSSWACGPPPIPPVPEQPIAFSHAAHVADGELQCTRCHPGAESAARAGLTPLRTCASCHRRTIPDHPEIVKLLAYWEKQEPILWQRVNFFPDSAMVHFNHGAHSRAGVECQECHGDHREMTVASPPINVANMGWCLDCHREREASIDCLTCHY